MEKIPDITGSKEEQIENLNREIDRHVGLIQTNYNAYSSLDEENRFSIGDEQEPAEDRREYDRLLGESNLLYDRLHALENQRASLWREQQAEK
jgi:hypothetical protein